MVRFNRFFPVLALALVSFATCNAGAQQSAADASTPQQPPTQQQRAQVLRQAQDRVRARRKLRDQQTIKDTYTHKYEVYFGGNYLRFHPGDKTQKINEAGWHVGVTDYAFGKIGVTVDGRGYYGTTYVGHNDYGVFAPSISQYTFMAGPSVRFFEGLHWGWSAHGLVGVGHGNFGTGTNGYPPELLGLYKDGNALNLNVGASVDYNLSPTLALRLTPSYMLTRYDGLTKNNLGYEGSVVWRWGRQ